MGNAGFPQEGPVPRTTTNGADLVALMTAAQRAFQASGRTLEWIKSGLLANRPAAFFSDRIFIATDKTPHDIYFDNGTDWIPVTQNGEFHITHLALDQVESSGGGGSGANESLMWVLV